MPFRQYIPVLVLLFALPLGYYASRCGVFTDCPLHPFFDGLSFTIFKPLWVFSLYGLIGTAFLPFVRKRVFKIWSRFACIWFLFTLFSVWVAPLEMNSWFYVISYVKEDVAYWMGTAFSFISICIILITSFIPYQKPRKGA